MAMLFNALCRTKFLFTDDAAYIGKSGNVITGTEFGYLIAYKICQ